MGVDRPDRTRDESANPNQNKNSQQKWPKLHSIFHMCVCVCVCVALAFGKEIKLWIHN